MNSLYAEMYRRMLRIRMFEEAAVDLMERGEIVGGLHATPGQEAAIVGACIALRDEDYMVGTHRSHGHPIGKGARLRPLMAELLGRATGINKGKGGRCTSPTSRLAAWARRASWVRGCQWRPSPRPDRRCSGTAGSRCAFLGMALRATAHFTSRSHRGHLEASRDLFLRE